MRISLGQMLSTLWMPLMRTGNVQAAGKADSYLSYSAFSRSGLVDQLLYEGYTSSEAEYGVASTNADWNGQAAKKAKSYLEYSSFSRQGTHRPVEI